MRQIDENYVSMCRAVQEVLKKQEAVWMTMVTFGSLAEQFEVLMEDISMAVQGAEVLTTGATEDKSNAKMNAILLATNLSKRASVYAMEVHNMELHNQLRVSKSWLLKRADTLCLAKLRSIHSRMLSIAPALVDYGVTVADLSQLDALNDGYDVLISRPRSLIIERKGYNQDAIPGLLSSMRAVLYKMDSLINLFGGSVLEREYEAARIIIDLGSRGKATGEVMG